MASKPYSGGSVAQSLDLGCPMLYKVMLIARIPFEMGAATVSSIITVSGIQNAEAYQIAFKDNPLIEVVIEPDTFGYIKRRHPHLDCSVDLMEP